MGGGGVGWGGGGRLFVFNLLMVLGDFLKSGIKKADDTSMFWHYIFVHKVNREQTTLLLVIYVCDFCMYYVFCTCMTRTFNELRMNRNG